MSNDVMVDLESLGNKPDSVIVSLAAQQFTIEDGPVGEGFSMNIDPMSCKELGFKVYQSTLDWWMEQSPSARAAWKKDPKPIEHVIKEFAYWAKECDRSEWWARGVAFDFAVLELYFDRLNIPLPWKFWNIRDQRTVLSIMDVKPQKRIGTFHVALDDCLTQIEDLRKIYGK